EMPADTLRSKRNRPHHVSDIWAESAHIPTDAAVSQAAKLLNQRKKPVIMAGRGAIGARKELEEIAEILGAPIVKPVLGKACVPDASPSRRAVAVSSAPGRRRTRSRAAIHC